MASTAKIQRGLDVLEETLGGGRQQLSPHARAAYERVLRDVSDEAWTRAVDAALATCRFFPRPAELRELAGGARPEDAARAAWDVVEHAMARLGAWESVDFGPEINAAVRHLGGWADLCATPLEHLVHRRREFESAVLGYLRGGVPAKRGEYLVGEYERAEIARTGTYGGVLHRLGPAAGVAMLSDGGDER